MSDGRVAPYGTWPSPIGASDVARAGVRLSFPWINESGVWWQETRPEENGRTTIMRAATDGTVRELLPQPWNARTRVHEYGGRSYLPVEQGLVFSNYADQRLYLASVDGRDPRPLTPTPREPTGVRYADFVLSADRTRLWCVRESPEEGSMDQRSAVPRAIVTVPLDGSAAADPAAIREVVSGSDFLAFPRPSPSEKHLAWIAWNHPRMPWDGTELRVGELADDGTIKGARTLKGGRTESVTSPAWDGERAVFAVSDWSGWWNIYRLGLFGELPEPLYPSEEEFGAPLWNLGGASFSVLEDGRLAVLHGLGGSRLGILDPETSELADLDLPYTVWAHALCPHNQTVVGIAGHSSSPPSVVRVEMETGTAEELRRELDPLPNPAYLPTPRSESLPGPFGREVHAHIYPPKNPKARGSKSERPPYLVFVHGGPTAHSVPVLDLQKAFFTSRGIGVIDVNYGGSTGYGRSYRERLRGEWGVVDVEDCVAAVQALVEAGEADGDRLAIRGGSAGGWTTLAALTRTRVFRAGTSYYGVAELLRFVEDTHDFESRYLDGLVGTLPDDREVYIERAPLSRVDDLASPVLLLQGMEDPIVLPSQSEMFAKALARKGIPYAFLTFEGESHGFRRAETLIHCLEAELSFYGQVFGFEPPDVPKLELQTRDAPIRVDTT